MRGNYQTRITKKTHRKIRIAKGKKIYWMEEKKEKEQRKKKNY